MSPVADIDFIIVGAGSADRLLVNGLSANPLGHGKVVIDH